MKNSGKVVKSQMVGGPKIRRNLTSGLNPSVVEDLILNYHLISNVLSVVARI